MKVYMDNNVLVDIEVGKYSVENFILVSDKSFFARIKIRAVSICRIQPFFVI